MPLDGMRLFEHFCTNFDITFKLDMKLFLEKPSGLISRT